MNTTTGIREVTSVSTVCISNISDIAIRGEIFPETTLCKTNTHGKRRVDTFYEAFLYPQISILKI
jgi:hypothetical protein